ncbi:DUF1317 family protein [Salmonella enterica subsp. enterica serovar Muenchen]|nr:DUF1317 family protein [Salmonella enterica]EBZ1028289.1 DUF1317 family protein [Salmonella enterica subsp. enterica serovar Muenchen]
MKHHLDAITVGKVKCMYSVILRGWYCEWGEVVRSSLNAHGLAEDLNEKQVAA